MERSASSEAALGDLLGSVKPNLVCVLLGCVPGGALCVFVAPFCWVRGRCPRSALLRFSLS